MSVLQMCKLIGVLLGLTGVVINTIGVIKAKRDCDAMCRKLWAKVGITVKGEKDCVRRS